MQRVRIGVIGCGAIAQVHHLPNLTALRDEFEVTAVCDKSPGAAAYAAEVFNVPTHVTDYRELLESDVEAVLLCHSDPKTRVAVAAFNAGKHVFIEKPMCFSLQEADAIIAACRESGKVGQAGYMKVYDPAFEVAKREVDQMDDIRFVQANHLHCGNDLHLRNFRITRFDDLPPDAMREAGEDRAVAVRDAIGDASDVARTAFSTLSGSGIHDLYGFRVMLGVPTAVVSTELWNGARAITTILEYPNGARCVYTWAAVPGLWDFKETLEVYGDTKRVIVKYPTGFSRGILSTVTVHEIEADGTTVLKEPAIEWESAFSREVRHFHDCITNGVPSRTSVADARNDIALIINIVKSYTEGARIPSEW
ncbi:MAG: Gfo/Idh/MocA family oxidoreductase [Candidatus Poribacteria bacterium]|nr:Gfo/Idh/MocA family oxidoreductase [Candidatus Poribacteria bacterium]